MTKDLLIEFVTEELPPRQLNNSIAKTFADSVFAALGDYLTPTKSSLQYFATPRRFACLITQVKAVASTASGRLKRGPAVAGALLGDGAPTTALLGFMKNYGLSTLQDLIIDNGYFYYQQIAKERELATFLPDVIKQALKSIVTTKSMRWGNNDFTFIRPVHNFLLLYGDKTLCQDLQLFGLTPVAYTIGHRIMSLHGQIAVTASDYEQKLHSTGYVIANLAKRRSMIVEQLQHQAAALALDLHLDEFNQSLLDEVTNLVEYPVVLNGQFNEQFLQIPPECLILSMARHQKYFALFKPDGSLSNHFCFVANLLSANPDAVVAGNEKVLTARLNDAQFFFEQDKNVPLAEFALKLDTVVYHQQLGSQLQLQQRIEQIALQIAPKLPIDLSQVKIVASVLKADLMSQMVAEFPELQGVMGKYYAIYHGMAEELAQALEEHYYPRFSNDKLADSKLGLLLALSDKLALLVGMWGIGIVPKGDKDPYALRRSALAVARILLILPLNLHELLQISCCVFGFSAEDKLINELYDFINQRLYHYLITEKSYHVHHVQSVLFNQPQQFTFIIEFLTNLQQFATSLDSQSLFAVNKRVENILDKCQLLNTKVSIDTKAIVDNATATTTVTTAAVAINIELLLNEAELNLYNLLVKLEGDIHIQQQQQNWPNYFALLQKFNTPINDFFAQVMVMDNNVQLRDNRLALLHRVYKALNGCCKLSRMSV